MNMDNIHQFLNLWSGLSISIRIIIFLAILVLLFTWMFLFPQEGKNTATPPIHKERSLTAADEKTIANNEKKQEKKQVEKEKILTQLPNFIFANNIIELREKYNLRPLRESENKMPLYQLSNGIFGWVESYEINTPKMWIPDSPFAPDSHFIPSETKLSQNKRYESELEIQKTQTGNIYAIVYITDQTRLLLENPTRNKTTTTVVSFREYKDFSHLIAIPREIVEFWENRTFGDEEPVADVRIK